jgi:hypothetical protein
VNGSNLNTGSRWRTTIKPDGSMRGYDADMNLWKYDGQSGRYTNVGTEVTCTGNGSARTATRTATSTNTPSLGAVSTKTVADR